MPKAKSTRRSSDIRATLCDYLIRRNYIETANNFKLSDFISSKQSSDESLRENCIDKKLSNPSSIPICTIVSDVKLAEDELSKFWSYVTKIQDISTKRDLVNVFVPVSLHLYLNNLQEGNKINNVFVRLKEIVKYANDDVLLDFMKTLEPFSSIKDIDWVPVYSVFRSGRYSVNVSVISMNCLQTYLDNNTPVLIADVINKWLDIEMSTSVVAQDLLTTSGILNSGYDGLLDVMSGVSGTVDVRDYKLLTDAIKEVRETPRNPSPALVFTLNNAPSVCCASTSPNHKYVATGSIHNELRLWNLQAFKLPPCTVTHIPLGCDFEKKSFQMTEGRYTTFKGHTGAVHDVAFHDRSDLILSVSRDCDMRVWKINDYTCAGIYSGHTRPIWCLDVGYMGMYIVTGSQDRSVRLWSLDRTHPLRVLVGHTQDINCVKLHPNGGYIASGSPDKTVRMWGITDNKMCRLFNGHSGSIQTLAFSPNGRFLASGGDGGRVKIWDIGEGKVFTDLKGNNNRVVSLDWSKDGSSLASLSSDGTIFFWRVKNAYSMGNDISVIEQPTLLSTEMTTGLSVQYTRRNTCVAVGIKNPSKYQIEKNVFA